VLKIATTPQVTLESVTEHLSANINGHLTPFTDRALSACHDIARIRKVYKVPAARAAPSKKVTNGVHSSDDNVKLLEAQVLGAMLLRGAT
jgi:EKC/KEOPS complex subunit CGI121/TPRKB